MTPLGVIAQLSHRSLTHTLLAYWRKLLIMTAEDKDSDGNFHARPNVIHELGLFQGHLGFNRAIMVFEEGTQEFSNIHGIHQVRFPKAHIKETFGDILAVIGREFKEAAP